MGAIWSSRSRTPGSRTPAAEVAGRRPPRAAAHAAPHPKTTPTKPGRAAKRGAAAAAAGPSARALTPAALRRVYAPGELAPAAGEPPGAPIGIIGQPRAVSALRFGLATQDPGFHIYVAGPPGIGKMTTIGSFLEEFAARRPTPYDLCYVTDFEDPTRPRALRLPPGEGRRLRQDVAHLVADVRRALPRAFASDEYGKKRDQVVRKLERERADVIAGVTKRAGDTSFSLQPSPAGIMVIAMAGDHPMAEAEFAALSEDERADLHRRKEALEDDIKASLKEIRRLEQGATGELETLDRQIARFVVSGVLEEVAERYAALPDVRAYLAALEADVLARIEKFKAGEPDEDDDGESPQDAWLVEREQRRYEVNVLVDHGKTRGAPVVVEWKASFADLFGRLEKETRFGSVHTDLTLLKPGALHRANGGFLVLPIAEVLRGPWSWDGLKRALRTGELHIEDPAERLGLSETRIIHPEPVALDVKLVLVGSAHLFYLLHAMDEDFRELFKVRADFDESMPATAENVQTLVAFLRGLCEREQRPALGDGGATELLEHAARLAEDQERLSARFGELSDALREASHWARVEGATVVGAEHVRRALAERAYRAGMLEAHHQEWVRRGTLLIDTHGHAVGQVNALSVVEVADSRFGRPTRITASVGPGGEGIVDIEREVQLAGPIHSKGVLILSGYLLRRFGGTRPLSLGARLTFEQSYDGIEGDSASSAELYAILSALADVPLRQGIAATGSVNQAGLIQAVGGVNDKIEGFFAACELQGLDGEQGVLIPEANREHLMLRREVVDAVAAGRFHVYTAKTVDEGLGLLTGLPAEEVFARVERRLDELGELLQGTGTRTRRRRPARKRA